MDTLLSIFIGISLSAAAGFRVFVPLLVMSIAANSGHLTLSPGFEWIGTTPALISFSIATVVEILAYYVPFVDNLLDMVATPAAIIAGVIITASTVTGLSPFLAWSLAIIAGGGVAGTIQSITGMTRLATTSTTGGLANPVVSSVELGGAAFLSVFAIFVPLVAICIVVGIMIVAIRKLRRKTSVVPGN
jgi:hypothetical protein